MKMEVRLLLRLPVRQVTAVVSQLPPSVCTELAVPPGLLPGALPEFLTPGASIPSTGSAAGAQ